MSPLPILAAAWMAGIRLEHAATGVPMAAWLAVATVCGAVAWRRRGGALLLLAVALAGGASSSAAWRARVGDGPTLPPPRHRIVVEGVIEAPLTRDAHGTRAVVEVDTLVAEGGRRQPVRLRLAARWSAGDVAPGDRVRAVGTVRPPRGYAVEGAFDRARFFAGRDLHGVLAVAPPGPVRLTAPPRRSIARAAHGWRARMSARIGEGDDGRALVRALALGDRAAVRPSLEAAFRDAGVTHVLSVSGLHLAAVAALCFWLVRAAWLRAGDLALRVRAERPAAAAAAVCAGLYAVLTGGETATLRALWAAWVVLAAVALGRRPHALAALAVAALVMLVGAPWSLFEPSFQLSFAAAAALPTLGVRLARLVPPARAWWARPLSWAGRLLAASLAAALATAPLTALHFGVVQPAGLIANLVVVPAAELVVLPLGLAGALAGALWEPLGAPMLWLAARVAGAIARLLLWAADLAPVLPVSPPSAFELAALGAGVVALALARPWRRALAVAALAAACTAASCGAGALQRARRDHVRVTFVDVGQGDAALVELPGGEAWLIDAGGRLFGAPAPGADDDERLAALAADPGERAVWPLLRARQVRRLAIVVISHPHPDHYGGLRALAEHVRIDELWISGDEVDDPAWRELCETLARRGTRVRRPPLGVAATRGGASLRVLAPRGAGGGMAPGDEREVNDDSLVVRLEFAGRALLFTGDLEAAGERDLVAGTPPELLRADVVKVAHHGSRTSSTATLVEATRPAYAVISCGYGNHFRFPAAEVVARWQGVGARVFRTDLDGSVTVTIGPGGELQIRTQLRRGPADTSLAKGSPP